MRSLTISDATLEQERKVVMEERRLRTDNDILGLLDEQLGATMWNAHPYRWPVIGWMGDIEAISKEQCQAFFHTYYAPNNATIYVVGDFDSKEALALIESHYGDIPSGPALPSVPTYEPAQKGERRAMVRYPAQSEALLIGYHAPAATDARVPALDLIQYALSAGEGAILNKTLVYEQEVAVNVMVDFGWRIDPGAFLFFLELAPGVPAKKAEEALFAEIAKIAEKGLSKNDFERAREMLTARSLRELATHNGRASAFGSAELLLGDWKAALSMVERYREVTPEQVKAIAAELFDPSRRSVITLDPTDPNAKPAKAKPAKAKPAKSAAKKKPAKRARA
jgi:predicted Zn-dependent peptidase